jgi:hypothetical protein
MNGLLANIIVRVLYFVLGGLVGFYIGLSVQ